MPVHCRLVHTMSEASIICNPMCTKQNGDVEGEKRETERQGRKENGSCIDPQITDRVLAGGNASEDEQVVTIVGRAHAVCKSRGWMGVTGLILWPCPGACKPKHMLSSGTNREKF